MSHVSNRLVTRDEKQILNIKSQISSNYNFIIVCKCAPNGSCCHAARSVFKQKWFFVKLSKWIYQKVVDVIVVGSAFSFPLAVVSVADLSLQKLCHLVQKRNSKLVCAMWLHWSLTKKRTYLLAALSSDRPSPNSNYHITLQDIF